MRSITRLLAAATFVTLSLDTTLPVASQDAARTYGFTFTPEAQGNGGPRILKVELNDSHLKAGGPIAIRVTTTPDVVNVTTGSGKRQGVVPQTAAGVFSTSSVLPHVGGIAAIQLKLHFEATTAAGESVGVDVPVSYK